MNDNGDGGCDGVGGDVIGLVGLEILAIDSPSGS